MKYIHAHLVGGPFCGESMNIKGEQHDEDEYELPEMLVIPISESEGELYVIGAEEAPCGYPQYLYAGYNWEPDLIDADWDEDEE